VYCFAPRASTPAAIRAPVGIVATELVQPLDEFALLLMPRLDRGKSTAEISLTSILYR